MNTLFNENIHYRIIDIYGLSIKCQTDSLSLMKKLLRPYQYFLSKNDLAEITIVVNNTDPPYNNFPEIEESFSTPRNVVYTDKHQKIIDYFGKGLVHQKNNVYSIYGNDEHFLMEAFYLLVFSLFGQYCDQNALLRIHALGISYRNTAIILPIPPGGGKSTLALTLLKDKTFKLISDDAPLFHRSGEILPFPLRIGVLNKNMIQHIPEKFVYTINRMEFGKKYFIDYTYWENQIEEKRLQNIIMFVYKRLLNTTPSIQKASKISAIKALMRDSVIGIGLYQGLEFILQNSAWEILCKILTVAHRTRLAIRFTLKAKTFQFTMSNDTFRNAQVLKEFIQNYHETRK